MRYVSFVDYKAMYFGLKIDNSEPVVKICFDINMNIKTFYLSKFMRGHDGNSESVKYDISIRYMQ